jgi:hypothetical protein
MPSKDEYISPDKRSGPQRKLQEAIKNALDRHRRGEPGVEVPRPCFKDDADPNDLYDAHHKKPLYLGGAEDDVNLCALRTDLHKAAHPRLNNQKDMLSHPVWIACRICSGQLPDIPVNKSTKSKGGNKPMSVPMLRIAVGSSSGLAFHIGNRGLG